MSQPLTLHLRSQALATDLSGHLVWQVRQDARPIDPARLAIIVCDVWDHHWCRGAEERLEVMLPHMNAVLGAARAQGARIIHAPSDTMTHYADHPARLRIAGLTPNPPPTERPHDDPPLPIDASDEGCDVPGSAPRRVWSSQHAAIAIDSECDVISDVGAEVLAYLQRERIAQTLILGVHTNMCVLHRSFAIKQMVRWGVSIALLRDLTDAMYNPARPPYVSHAEGTALVIGFIEKHWCPSIASGDLLG